MKNALVCLALIVPATAAAATPMVKVVGVRDSRTIVVAGTNGDLSVVKLENVAVAPEEESDATAYLRHLVAKAWVLVEKGDVYRSPDALYINGEMNSHPWRTMKILGELDLGARSKGQDAGNKVTAPAQPPPPQRATPSSRGTRASQKGSRRTAPPQ